MGGCQHNPVKADSLFDFHYFLEIENLTGGPVNVNFGNQMHGLFAVSGFSGSANYASAVEEVRISDLTVPGGTGGNVVIDWRATQYGAEPTGLWESFVHPTLVHDDFYGDIPGFELNSLEYYGSRLVDTGATVFSFVKYRLFLAARLDFDDGLALVDFSNTGHLTVTATDPITGEDRSAGIRVTVVDAVNDPGIPGIPEPGTLALTSLSAMALLRQRRVQGIGARPE